MRELKLEMNELAIKHIVKSIILLGTDILGNSFTHIVKSNLEGGVRKKVGMQGAMGVQTECRVSNKKQIRHAHFTENV